MGTVDDGARVAVEVCMGVKPGERVLVVTDAFTRVVGEALKKAAENVSPENVRLVLLEDFGERPLTSLAKPLEESIRWANVTFYAARSMGGELSLRKPFIKLAKEYAWHAHMPSINERLMQEGMSADYEKVSQISKTRSSHPFTSPSETPTQMRQAPIGSRELTLTPS